jgi:hypothetical protein
LELNPWSKIATVVVVGVEDDEYVIIYRLKIVSLHSSLVVTFGSTFDLRTFFTLTQRELPDRRGIY